jgi:flagellar hook-basal body complex protein FliE
MIPVGSIASATQVLSAYGSQASQAASSGTDFSSMVGNAAETALQTLRQSEQITTAGVAGKADVQQVVQALGDAEVTMQTVVAVRDKVMGAYNDIMRMTV